MVKFYFSLNFSLFSFILHLLVIYLLLDHNVILLFIIVNFYRLSLKISQERSIDIRKFSKE